MLLDHSGSMGRPFRAASVEFAGRSVRSTHSVKLDAAREALRERMRGLNAEERVILIAFTSTAKVVFEGPVRNRKEIGRALDELEATNGTSIAAALDCAYESLASIESFSRVLVVSDCETDMRSAEQAANRVSRLALIDVLLIDPSPKTEEIARAIIHLGEVQAVTGPEELRTGVMERDVTARQVAATIENERRRAASAAITGKANAAVRFEGQGEVHPVEFAVGHPGTVMPDRWSTLHVYVYAAHLRDRISQWLHQKLSEETTSSQMTAVRSQTFLGRGAQLRIEPVIPGIVTNPLRVDVMWNDLVEYLRFRFRPDVSRLGEQVLGSVNIYYGPARIAAIPISFDVSNKPILDEPRTSTASLFVSVFCAYAREDKKIVDLSRANFEALGIEVFQDSDALRKEAGSNWRRAIQQLIDRADAFQLFWSFFARASAEVEREWLYALRLIAEAIKDERFVRPVCWEERVPPLPTALENLQMAWITLPGLCPNLVGRPRRISVAIPLVPVADEQRRAIETESSVAIEHIEQVTGLACAPPVTLLVDEWAVHHIKSSEPVISPLELATNLWAIGQILGALVLGLHVGIETDGAAEPFRPRFGAAGVLRDTIRMLAEGVIGRITETVLEWGGFSARNQYGKWVGPPRPVVEPVEPPVERARRWLSSPSHHSLRVTLHTRPENPNVTAWIGQHGINLVFLDTFGSLPPTESAQLLAKALETAFEKGGAQHIDQVGPLDGNLGGGYSTEVEAFGWIADSLFRAIERPDLRALAEVCSLPSWRKELNRFGRGAQVPDPEAVPGAQLLRILLDRFTMGIGEAVAALGGDQIYRCGFAIEGLALECLKSQFDLTKLNWQTRKSIIGEDRDEREMVGRLDDIMDIFQPLASAYLTGLEQLCALATGCRLANVRTYGVYVQGLPADDQALREWAIDRDIRVELTLPGTPKILLCVDALARRAADVEEPEARERLRCSVLIHEHFHAAVAEAVGSDPIRLEQVVNARSLEESLAVWLELEAARDCPALEALIRAYAAAGAYPVWPYGGALVLEQIYAQDGAKPIRRLIDQLVTNPAAALAKFQRMKDVHEDTPIHD